MVRLEYSGKYFKILNGFDINTSSRQVTFSDVVIDFTGYKMEDLPINYQEVRIWQNDEVIYTGYINSFDLPKMQHQEQYIELSLNLLSPMQMATNKVVTIIGTYELKSVINKVFEPLLQDGFIIKEMNVRDGQKTVSFLLQTIEYVMNALSHNENLWWFINEKKEIFVNSLDYQFGLEPVMFISHNDKIKGLLSISPSVEAVNYANVINVKNAKVYIESYYYSYDSKGIKKPLSLVTNIKNGDSIDFSYPIDIKEETIRKLKNRSLNTQFDGEYVALYIGTTLSTTPASARIVIDKNDEYIISENIGFDNEEGKDFILKRDSFYKNLITGFTYKGKEETTINVLISCTALESRRLKFINSQEIERNKNKVSTSGIIEKTFDMNNRWFFETDLIDEVKSMMSINSNQTNIVKLEFDYDYKLKIGNILNLDLPNFFTKGDFIITDITYSKSSIEKWIIILRSSDVLENYIDLFREKQSQESEEQEYSIMLAEYVEEQINENHEVVEVDKN